jgi:hypothetical protein
MNSICAATGGASAAGIDYGGNCHRVIWARRLELSVSLIPNLIFTDNAASAVVGKKGVLGHFNGTTTNVVPILTTPTVLKMKCN